MAGEAKPRSAATLLILMGWILGGCGGMSRLPVRFPDFAEQAIAGPGSYRLPRWSPDGRYLAFLDASNAVIDLEVYDTHSGRIWTVVSGVSESYDWDPQGHLSYLKYRPELSGTPFPEIRDLHRVDIDGQNDTIIASSLHSAWDFDWFDDGQRIAILQVATENSESGCTDIYSLDIATGASSVLVSGQDLGVTCIELLALSSEGSRLMAYGLRGKDVASAELIIYDLENETSITVISPAQDVPGGGADGVTATIGTDLNMEWIAGDTWIVAKAITPSGECYNYSLFFFSTSEPETNFCMPGQGGPFAAPTISPDTRQIAYITVVGPGVEYVVVGQLPSELISRLEQPTR